MEFSLLESSSVLMEWRKPELSNSRGEDYSLKTEEDSWEEQSEAIIFFILLILFKNMSLVLDMTIMGCSYLTKTVES